MQEREDNQLFINESLQQKKEDFMSFLLFLIMSYAMNATNTVNTYGSIKSVCYREVLPKLINITGLGC